MKLVGLLILPLALVARAALPAAEIEAIRSVSAALSVSIPEDVCSHAVVTCTNDSIGYALDFGRIDAYRVKGRVAAAVGQLVNMEALVIPPGATLTGPLPTAIGACRRLKSLSIVGAGLPGPLPAAILRLPRLQELIITDNPIASTIPSALNGFGGTLLRLSNNQLNGSIPPIGDTQLTTLDLFGNSLSGPIPLLPANLEWLDLGGNYLSGHVPVQLGDLVRLKYMKLSKNRLTGTLPKTLQNLDLLEEMWMDSNQIIGPLPLIDDLASLKILRLNRNAITGSIWKDFGTHFPSIEQAYFFDNQLTGEIPSSLCSLTGLKRLSVRTNQLTGSIPKCFSGLVNLELFWCFANQLSGPLPEITWVKMTSLRVEANHLSGSIPDSVGNLSSVQTLFLSENKFEGVVPELSGLIALTNVDFSKNSLIGNLPALPPSIRTVKFNSNGFNGTLPESWRRLLAVRMIDVSSNSLGTWVSWGRHTGYGTCSGNYSMPPPQWPELMDLKLSMNNFNLPVSEFVMPITFLPNLRNLACVSCGLSGEMTSKAWTDLTFDGDSCTWEERLDSLELVDFSNNSITAWVPLLKPLLHTVILSHNALTSISPDYFGSLSMQNLGVDGNPSLIGPVLQTSTACADVVGSSSWYPYPTCLIADTAEWQDASAFQEAKVASVPLGFNLLVSSIFNTTALRRCYGGYELVSEGPVCAACPRGKYSMAGNQCEPCPASSSTDAEGSEGLASCRCEPGFQSLAVGVCLACTPGRYARAASGSCSKCPAGTFSKGSSGECMPCDNDASFSRMRTDKEQTTCHVYFNHTLFMVTFFLWFGGFVSFVAQWQVTNDKGARGVCWRWTLSARAIRIQDVSLRKGEILITTHSTHRLHMSWRKSFKVKCFESSKGLDGRNFQGKVVNAQQIQLLFQRKEDLPQMVESSKGFLRLHPVWILFHTGWPLPLVLQFPLWVGIVLTVASASSALENVTIAAAAFFAAFVVSRLWITIRMRSRTMLETCLDLYDAEIKSENPSPRKCPRGPDRALKAGQLQQFFEHFRSVITDRNMYFVESNIIRPLTKPYRLSFAEFVGPHRVQWFVSHFWGEALSYTVESIEKHAMEFCTSGNWKDVSYWICTLSINQYAVAEEIGVSSTDSSFYITLWSGECRGTCMVLGEHALPLTRSWCLFELIQTMKLQDAQPLEGFVEFKGLLLCTSTGVLNFGKASIETTMAIVRRLATISLEEAQASMKADKDMIDNIVETEMGGFRHMNRVLRRQVHKLLDEARSSMATEFDQLAEILDEEQFENMRVMSGRFEESDTPQTMLLQQEEMKNGGSDFEQISMI